MEEGLRRGVLGEVTFELRPNEQEQQGKSNPGSGTAGAKALRWEWGGQLQGPEWST